MKKFFNSSFFIIICVFIAANMISLWSLAQDSASHSVTSTQTTTTSNNFVVQPWMWITGGIVLLLIITAVIGSNRSTTRADKVTYTKTVTRDDNV